LNFSRTAPTDIGDVDLGRVITEVLSLVEHQLQQGGIVVNVDMPKNVPPIRGNASKLQQVFLNLILNARDAMEESGTLSIRVSADAGSANVIVADTGKGIPPENVRRIFDPFFTTKGARKGTGLGLSITYGIVEEHGGTIEVESRLGKGTKFSLTFPLARKERPELITAVNA
jgi:signal transduction histidine kinase